MKVQIGEVEFVQDGASQGNKERFKSGKVTLADGSEAYITLYRAPVATAPVATVPAKAPAIRKGKGVQSEVKVHTRDEVPGTQETKTPATNPAADLGLTPEQLAKLAKVLAALKA